MKKSKALLSCCRYFGGEVSCPFSDSQLRWFWDMERVFVEHGGVFEGESGLYKAVGGKSFPGIPFALLMVMFTSWGKSAYDVKASLPEFYALVGSFLEVASDHFPVDKIPGQK